MAHLLLPEYETTAQMLPVRWIIPAFQPTFPADYVTGTLLESAVAGAHSVQGSFIVNFDNWRDRDLREGNDAPTVFGSIDLRDGRLEVLAGMPYLGIKLLIDLWLGGASTFITLTGDRLKRRKARFHDLSINNKRPNYE